MSAMKKSSKDVFGFQEIYNQKFYRWLAIPWSIFCLSQLVKININNFYCNPDLDIPGLTAAPGECYYYINFPRYNYGIWLHLSTVLPAGFLAVLQFTPVIRARYRRFHRLAGYASTILGLLGILSAFAIMDKAFGGDMSTVSASSTIGLASGYALFKGVMEARAKRISSHRDWMLRAWMYMGTILTMRLFMPLLALAISVVPQLRQHTAISCEVIKTIYKSDVAAAFADYPVCAPENAALNPLNQAVVLANMLAGEAERQASLRAIFGSAEWLAMFVHGVGIEVYLRWTKGAAAAPAKPKHVRMETVAAGAEKTAQAFSSAVAGSGAPAQLNQLTSLTR